MATLALLLRSLPLLPSKSLALLEDSNSKEDHTLYDLKSEIYRLSKAFLYCGTVKFPFDILLTTDMLE